MLFTTVPLPTVLLMIFTVVPPDAAIPLNIAATLVDEFNKKPAIVLFEKLITLPVPPPLLSPMGPPVLAIAVNTMPGVEVVEPIKFPAIVPTLAFPLAILIPSKAAEPVFAVVISILVMVLF